MATIVQGGPDLRQAALQGGVASGVENFLAQRKKKKQDQKFVDAFRAVNEAPDYDTAVRNMATVDPDLLQNPQAMQMLNDQIARKFPATEALEVINPRTRAKTTITHRKGAPPSDEQLAKQGYTRASSMGLSNFLSMNEGTGEVDAHGDVTREEAEAAAPGRMVVGVEEASEAAALKNAYANMVQSSAQRERTGTEKKPTQFEQEVDAIQQRLGLEDRNQAINVHQFAGPTLKSFRDFYTKGAGGEIFFTDDIARGHIANAESILEPGLASLDSPDTVKKLMIIDTTFNIANDPNIKMQDAKDKASTDFTRLTGLAAGDRILNQIMQQAQVSLSNGQIVERPVKDQSGKTLYKIRLAKIGGRVIPLQQVTE